MGEAQKTAAYIGVALVLGIVTVVTRPKVEDVGLAPMVNKPLFDKFTDPSKASSLEIVRYAEEIGEVNNFEVAKNPNTGLWSIPSHGNYPADAQDQMKDAATSLSGVTILGVATQDPQEHQLFGVVEPNKEKLKIGDKGVGLLVSFRDEKGGNLARLIIGKKDRQNEEQRYVRIPGQDAVYVAKISTDKLSTKFEDWIEKDLLKLKVFDVERLRLKDYSIVPTAQNYAMQPRAEMTVSVNSADAKWNLDRMITYKGQETQESGLLEGEELDKEKLDGLKNALGDIKIVDVFRKPKGLGATLKASGDFANDAEGRRSLESRGFIINPKDNELLAANGELHALTKDGVEYVLRFGNVAGEEEGTTGGKLNRYLFVTARLDESKFPEPPATQEPTGDAAPATDGVPPVTPPAGPPPAGDQPPAAPQNPSVSPANSDSGCTPQEKKADDAPGAAAATNQPPAAETPKPEDQPADKPSDAPPPAPPAAGEKPGEKSGDLDLQKKKQDVERERIRKENQRKLDEAREKREKAEQTVQELNARFADWYYVISEDVYKKLHLSRSDIIKEGAKSADEGTGPDAFRKLQKEGLKKKSEVKSQKSDF